MSYAGAKRLTSFMDAVGIKSLGEDHLGQLVPKGARHRPGRLLASLVAMLATGGEHVSDLDRLRSGTAVTSSGWRSWAGSKAMGILEIVTHLTDRFRPAPLRRTCRAVLSLQADQKYHRRPKPSPAPADQRPRVCPQYENQANAESNRRSTLKSDPHAKSRLWFNRKY